MKRKVTPVDTSFGPIEVRTEFEPNWWLVVFTFGLVWRGRHTGKYQGEGVRHAWNAIQDLLRDRGEDPASIPGFKAAREVQYALSRKASIWYAEEYHQQVMREAKDFCRGASDSIREVLPPAWTHLNGNGKT